METVAIIGTGLIGASFGLALQDTGFTGAVLGVSSPQALEEALEARAITKAVTLEEACGAADVLYLSQTVDRIVETIRMIGPMLRPGALVTDAGSTKRVITEAAASNISDHCFVGGHPLAGKEVRGAAAADSSLFRDRPYVLCPPQGPPSQHIDSFRNALTKMGARIIEVGAEEHDNAIAFTSHLPQLISTALAFGLAETGNPLLQMLHGPGLTDMTRLALSSAELWQPILNTNRDFVLASMDVFSEEFRIVRSAVADGNLGEVFRSGREFAALLRLHDAQKQF